MAVIEWYHNKKSLMCSLLEGIFGWTTLIKMSASQNEKINSLSQNQALIWEEISAIKEDMSSMKKIHHFFPSSLLNRGLSAYHQSACFNQ